MKWSGVVTGPLSVLEDILLEWIKINKSIIKKWAPDVPWRYNERASLSILAGAVWRKGGVVLEEFTTEKRKSKKPSNNVKLSNFDYCWGRSDMYFEIGDLECEIEAKYRKPYIEKVRQPNKVLLKNLLKAVEDVSRNRVYDNRLRLGLLIITPILSYTVLKKDNKILLNWEDYLSQWINSIKNLHEVAAAWFFPNDLDSAVFENSRRNNHYFPGVALIFQKAKDQSR